VTAYCHIGGDTILEATVVVPNVGPWYANLVFEGAPDVSGAVVLNVGALELHGFVDPRANGVFGEQRRCRVVAGAAGWGTVLPALHYHSDSGVRSRSVADDAARLAGETIGAFNPTATQVGIDYTRQAGLASRVLEDVIGTAPWWVGYDGRTNVGARSASTPDVETYEVLEHDPRLSLVELAVDDLAAITIGARLNRPPLVDVVEVHELEIIVASDRARVRAWYGGTLTARGRIARSLQDIARRSTDGKLFGRYRFRVVQMSGDRVELQAVASIAGLPDVLPISMRPGVAGASSALAGGSIVLVEFIEGDRTMPIVSAFTPKGDPGHAPDETVLEVVSTLRLGDPGATDPVALAPSIDSQFDDINSALDAFAVAVPVPNDGGAFIQSAFKAVWGPGAPPKPPSNVGATKVVGL
jgi:hypothetical protein